MGQRVIGLDVGSQSVRVAVFDASFRKLALTEVVERAIPTRQVAWSEEWVEALGETLKGLRGAGILQGETIVTALAGDKLSSRTLTLPFTEAKQVDGTLGFELENFLPYSVEDIVYDYVVLEKLDTQTRVMAFAVERGPFETMLSVLQEAGIDPRLVGVGSLSYMHLLRNLPVQELGPIAVVDIGAFHTDIAVFAGGKPELARTVLRGGHQITEAIAVALETEHERAEHVKRDEGLVAVEDAAYADDRQAALAAAARAGLDPLVRKIHMTLQARLAQVEGATEVARVYVCGGGAELRGLYDYLEAALEVPVEPLPLGELPWNQLEGDSRGAVRFAKAITCGLRGTTSGVREDINFRRGSFTYKGDFAFLQGKLVYLAALVVALLGVAGFKSYLTYEQLQQELDGQYAALENYSKAVIGKPVGDFSTALDELKKLPTEDSLDVFPQITAARALYDISTVMVEVGNTTRDEVLALRGMPTTPADSPAGADGADTEKGPGGPPSALPGAGEARDPSAAPGPTVPGGIDPLFPDGPPGMIRPPGPGSSNPPTMDPEALREERARRLREFRERRAGAMEGLPQPTSPAARMRGTPVAPTPRAPVIPGQVRPGTTAPPRPAPAPSEGIIRNTRADDDDDDPPARDARERGAAASPPAGSAASEGAREDRLQLELESITVDSQTISLKGEANSIEAATIFEQRLRRHPCFQEVSLEGTERITFDRHRNWYTFRLSIKLECQDEVEGRTGGQEAN